VGVLRQALNAEVMRAEAAEALGQLIDEIRLMPEADTRRPYPPQHLRQEAKIGGAGSRRWCDPIVGA